MRIHRYYSFSMYLRLQFQCPSNSAGSLLEGCIQATGHIESSAVFQYHLVRLFLFFSHLCSSIIIDNPAQYLRLGLKCLYVQTGNLKTSLHLSKESEKELIIYPKQILLLLLWNFLVKQIFGDTILFNFISITSSFIIGW